MSKGRCWTEIDLSAIRNNYRIYSALQPAGRTVMAVVKADAYGHGDVQVAGVLQSEGCRDFAVSNLNEAVKLRESGIMGQILILGYTPVEYARELKVNQITQALVSREYTEKLIQTGVRVKCQYAVDSGMRRIGLNAEDPAGCESAIRFAAKHLDLTGLFTHLCVADSSDEVSREFTRRQIALFEELSRRVADLGLPYVHCMNSAGGLWHESSMSCFARLGIVLYGLKPDDSNLLPDGIRPALTWKSAVSMVKDIHTGDTVGYGRTFRAEHNMRIATVSCGYADGYNRLLSNRGHVYILGNKAPIVGRVCMDQFMVDVTDIPNVSLGSEVVLIGDGLTADDMARMIGTIGYEIVCDISSRVERTFLNG